MEKKLCQNVFTIEDYHNAWILRNSDPTVIFDKLNSLIKNINYDSDFNELFIAFNYFYNHEVENQGKECMTVKIIKDILKVFIELQKQIQNEIASKGIYLELCPSSNIIIG